MNWGGVRTFLREADEIEVVGDCANLDQALATLPTSGADVVLIAAAQRSGSTVTQIAEVQTRLLTALIVVLAPSDYDPDLVVALAGAGARGYIVWNMMTLEMLHHFLTLELDATALPMSIDAVRAIPAAAQRRASLPSDAAPLTLREREILVLAVDGRTDAEIAQQLAIEETTVTTHMRHIRGKLHATTTRQALAIAVRRGLA